MVDMAVPHLLTDMWPFAGAAGGLDIGDASQTGQFVPRGLRFREFNWALTLTLLKVIHKQFIQEEHTVTEDRSHGVFELLIVAISCIQFSSGVSCCNCCGYFGSRWKMRGHTHPC